jgi:hypothetical protein
MTPDVAAAEVLSGRHGMVSFARPDQIGIVADVCQSFVLDNGAFAFWKTGKRTDWGLYYEFVDKWRLHPGFDWAVVPDVIDGSADENDALLAQWPFGGFAGVPVWHLHEPIDRLVRMSHEWPRVAFGSSAQYSKVGSEIWWRRASEAMDAVCVDGSPICKIHGLRMLDPRVFTLLPFSSADSTNVARNIGIDAKWKGTYTPVSKAARGVVIADRIESQQSAPRWASRPLQGELMEGLSLMEIT